MGIIICGKVLIKVLKIYCKAKWAKVKMDISQNWQQLSLIPCTLWVLFKMNRHTVKMCKISSNSKNKSKNRNKSKCQLIYKHQ